MEGNATEVATQPMGLQLIEIPRVPSDRPYRRRIAQHKRDKTILGWAIVSGLLFAIVLIQWGIIYILQAGPI